nr:DNA-3-methyladenine glycosylase I [Agrilactobacillus yilanensis]
MLAGLSWQTILNKRQALNTAFCKFDYQKVQYFQQELPDLPTHSYRQLESLTTMKLLVFASMN